MDPQPIPTQQRRFLIRLVLLAVILIGVGLWLRGRSSSTNDQLAYASDDAGPDAGATVAGTDIFAENDFPEAALVELYEQKAGEMIGHVPLCTATAMSRDGQTYDFLLPTDCVVDLQYRFCMDPYQPIIPQRGSQFYLKVDDHTYVTADVVAFSNDEDHELATLRSWVPLNLPTFFGEQTN